LGEDDDVRRMRCVIRQVVRVVLDHRLADGDARLARHEAQQLRAQIGHRYNVTPTIQGLNSSSPTPASSLFVCFPDATARSSAKISAPTSSTPAPSRIRPAFTSMSGSCAA